MQLFIEALTRDWLHILIATVVGGLFLTFLWFVLLRGIRLWWSLGKVLGQIKTVKRELPSEMKAQLREAFDEGQLAPLWEEYEDTLHEQVVDKGIEKEVTAVRATVPAESFFNSELVVEGRLHTEFFKHLPGIFTGLGIIATFSGLIAGLQSFDVTAVDPDALKNSLGGLFLHVWSAFLLSAVAIGLAMLCTILEKVTYAANLHRVASIAAELDGMFRAGVGEEYLSKLLRTSEEGTAQTKQLKESLVEDLKSLLTNLTEQQIQATRQLSTDIGTSLESSLQAPLQKIADTVQMASHDQSASAGRMIENLMTAFMAQMRDTMGGQMGDLSTMMRQSAEAVTRVEVSLRSLVADMQQASQSSSQGIQSAMTDLLSALASHDKQQVEASGNASAQMMAQMSAAIEKMSAVQELTSSRVSQAAAEASGQIATAAAEAQRVSERSAERANELSHDVQRTTLDAIGQLESGAGKIASMLVGLESTVDKLMHSGDSVAGVHEKAAQLSAQIEATATALRKGAESLDTSSQALSQASIRVEGVSGLMAAEAGAREAALRDVQLALSRSQEAALEFASFSEMVTEKMEQAVESFGDRTTVVLNRTLTDFDKELSNAVEMLGGLIERMKLYAVDQEG